MLSKNAASGIYRIIDANANRLKEGLRVCEEVARFILNDRSLSRKLKTVRHDVDAALAGLAGRRQCLDARDPAGDQGRTLHTGSELKRSGVTDVFSANIQRVKESIRVLEEFSKIVNKACALRFKDLRYRVYEIEKRAQRAIR